MTPERYARVKELFLLACELDKSERLALLTEQCGSDAELRKEVESLLAHDNSQTLIRSDDDTLPSVHAGTIVQPARRSMTHQLQTFSLLTKRLGPRGHLAIGAFVACFLLMAIVLFVSHSVRAFQRTLRAEALEEILDAKSAGLEMWFDHEEEKIESWARSEEFQRLANELIQLAVASDDDWVAVRDSP
ncbi:MAG TPA: hypothetical protein P5307_19215, partial [Pirellulaceae bacterium]|nr:hypothetical protein [Pirellulaceae bacterium]